MHVIKFTLAHPFEVKGRGLVHTLEARVRATVGDMRAALRAGEGSDDSTNAALLALLCGLLPEDLDGMDLEDYEALARDIAAAKAAAGKKAQTTQRS